MVRMGSGSRVDDGHGGYASAAELYQEAIDHDTCSAVTKLSDHVHFVPL